jgi:hypothetical protein
MKLAEALSLRKDCQKKIVQLKARILSNVKVQEGDEPAEQPAELMREMEACLQQLQELIFRINVTNMKPLPDGSTLTAKLALRDVLTLRIQALREIFDGASDSQERYSRSEIKMVKTVDVKALHKQIDDLSGQLRKLDIEIQALNFTVELA